MSARVAFFDIDGTIFRSSLLVELVETLVAEGTFPQHALGEYTREYFAWQNREGTYEAYINAVVKTFMQHIKGVHYGDLADVGKMLVAEQGKHVYRYTRDLIRELKKDGYHTVAISQSPKVIVDDFCNAYGFDKVYGRIYEIGPTDFFTGVVTDEHLIENKSNIVRRVFEKGDYQKEGSVAVGDTEGDIPMLEMVDTPICFNPNQKLYQHAKRVSWKVVVERKDVIYEL